MKSMYITCIPNCGRQPDDWMFNTFWSIYSLYIYIFFPHLYYYFGGVVHGCIQLCFASCSLYILFFLYICIISFRDFYFSRAVARRRGLLCFRAGAYNKIQKAFILFTPAIQVDIEQDDEEEEEKVYIGFVYKFLLLSAKKRQGNNTERII